MSTETLPLPTGQLLSVNNDNSGNAVGYITFLPLSGCAVQLTIHLQVNTQSEVFICRWDTGVSAPSQDHIAFSQSPSVGEYERIHREQYNKYIDSGVGFRTSVPLEFFELSHFQPPSLMGTNPRPQGIYPSLRRYTPYNVALRVGAATPHRVDSRDFRLWYSGLRVFSLGTDASGAKASVSRDWNPQSSFVEQATIVPLRRMGERRRALNIHVAIHQHCQIVKAAHWSRKADIPIFRHSFLDKDLRVRLVAHSHE